MAKTEKITDSNYGKTQLLYNEWIWENEYKELEQNCYDQKHTKKNCGGGQKPQGIVVPTEDKVTVIKSGPLQ